MIKQIYVENQLNSNESQERRQLVVTLMTRSTAIYCKQLIPSAVELLIRIIGYFWRRLEEEPKYGDKGLDENSFKNIYYILKTLKQIVENLLEDIKSREISEENFNYLKPRLDRTRDSQRVQTNIKTFV